MGLSKNELLNMNYIQIESGSTDTIFKKFDNGNMFIFQYSENKNEMLAGICITIEQFNEIYDKSL